MAYNSDLSLADQLSATLDWWRLAGVDHAYEDDVTVWAPDAPEPEQGKPSAEQAPAAKPKAQAAPEKKIGGDPENWPADLAAFRQWWLEEPSLEAGGATPRIAPRGPQGARLMVLVPEPEAGDSESLLSGPQGRLLSSFFQAAGLEEDDVYLASGLPRHTPLADWEALARAGLKDIALHHIALVKPQRVLLLGRSVLPLVGHNPAQKRGSLQEINHHGHSFPSMISRNLEVMLARPATRMVFWQRWLDWTKE